MTPRDIAALLAKQADSVASMLLPGGKRVGNEYRAGDTTGGNGKSLGVHLSGEKAGVWCDFATGETGDLLDLWCSARGITLPAALTEAKAYLGVKAPNYEAHKPKAYARPKKPSCKKLQPESPVFRYLTETRKLTPDTLREFRIAERPDGAVLPYLRDGELVFVKLRKLDGEPKTVPLEKNMEPCLFGWQAIDDDARSVIICEGEIDAMTWSQMGFNALSVPFGGGGGGKQAWVENEYDRLDRFDDIVLALDNDIEGQKATQELLKRLGRERCYVITLPYKDANEALQKGATAADFSQWIAHAKTIDPDGLRNATDFTEDVVAEFMPPEGGYVGMSLPWAKTHGKIIFRPAEITIWTGFSGHGKSQLVNHVMTAAMYNGERVCEASMEMPARRNLYRMVKQILGVGEPSIPAVRTAMDWLGDKFWLFDVVGTAKTKQLLEAFTYAARRYGVTQFVVDSLAKCGIAEDDYNGQKAVVEQLIDFAHQYNVHVHLIVHPRKADDEGRMPGKMDVKGTGAITDMADNVLCVWRHKAKEANPDDYKHDPDCKLICSKQRYNGWEGVFKLWFDPRSLQYLSAETDHPAHYVDYRREIAA